jgi:hypothetical protein
MQNLNSTVRTHIKSEKTLRICTIFMKKCKASEINFADEFNIIFNLFKELFDMFNTLANQTKIIAMSFQFMQFLFASLEEKYHINEEK